ncbi:MAG: hypothetical protein SPF47_09200, partial [Gemmiger sp.]|nr:hypothetical protein [Gemmiger sp.]
MTTTNRRFLALDATVQNQQNSRFNVGLYGLVVVLRPGRPEVRILPVAPKSALQCTFAMRFFYSDFRIILVAYHLPHPCTD